MTDTLNVIYHSHFIATPGTFLDLLEKELVHLKQQKIYNKYLVPRKVAAYADDTHITYTYSGVKVTPYPWTPTLSRIKELVEKETGFHYNYCLVNLYRNGNDSIGKHQDNERSLEPNHPIACVSFGETRTFIFSRPGCQRIKYHLNSGSLLIMNPPTNQYWFHEIPKEPLKTGKRLSLTFRRIV